MPPVGYTLLYARAPFYHSILFYTILLHRLCGISPCLCNVERTHSRGTALGCSCAMSLSAASRMLGANLLG